MTTEEPFCGYTLLSIAVFYKENVSGHIDMPICIIGSVLNLLNLLIFTRKDMSSPINLIFTNLSLVDLLTLIMLIPFSWNRITQHNGDAKQKSYAQALFFEVSYDAMSTFHFISTFLTVMLAIWRYIAVVHPFTLWHRCTMKSTRNAVVAVYITGILLSTPFYLSRNIKINSDNKTQNYSVVFNKDSILFSMAFIIRGVLQYILPSVLLPIFSIKLIAFLLTRKNPRGQEITSPNVRDGNSRNLKIKQPNDRSVAILLTVVVLFFITKFPSGILYLMFTSYAGSNDSQNVCFHGLRAIFRTLTVIDMSIKFMLYYSMSQNFRITFKSLFNSQDISIRKRSIFTLSNTKKSDIGPDVDQL